MRLLLSVVTTSWINLRQNPRASFPFCLPTQKMADHGNVHIIDSKERWTAKLEDKSKTIVVDFTATWCGPCRIMTPLFTDLSKRYGSLVFLTVDVDEFQDIASEWDVHAMPTFLFIKDGKVVDKIVGANKDELESKVKGFAYEEHKVNENEDNSHRVQIAKAQE